MHLTGHNFNSNLTCSSESPATAAVLEWDWDIEHADRKREAKADAALHGALPFQVDRKVLKDVVREKMNLEVGRITFLSAGTFHKAYLVTLADRSEVVARVARRFMPRLKTESEVATLHYLKEKTNVPVPTVHHYDSNPYNRLGGEFIIMSKAPGIPLAKVFHSLGYNDLVKLLNNMAAIIIPLFAHRFSDIGSLYFGPNPRTSTLSPIAQTPRAVESPYSAFPFSPTLSMSNLTSYCTGAPNTPRTPKALAHEFHVGPIISWPFFGTNRGDLVSPTELDRGPWPTAEAYFASCAEREITGVIRENEGRSAPHRLHLDPAEIRASRHHHLTAVPGDQSDDSDEWDLEDSENEWEGPGDVMYRDYRRMQRSTFLVAHMTQREESVRKEMFRWMNIMQHLSKAKTNASSAGFGLDCHDLSLENVFVDSDDHTKIACIIDWESTTIRPLWACAHLPAFLQSSPFTANLFREVVSKIASGATEIASRKSQGRDVPSLAREWLQHERAGVRLRMAHRFVEWDGWEEGLIETMLGPEETDCEWYKDIDVDAVGEDREAERRALLGIVSPPVLESAGSEDGVVGAGGMLAAALMRRKPSVKLPFVEEEKEKENMLTTTGDICGGRGGELGRRLEAWLTVNELEHRAVVDSPWQHGDDVVVV